MPNQNTENNNQLKAWNVETLRLTAFPSSAPGGEPTGWADLIHEPPEKEIVLPKQSIRQITGLFGKGNLILQISPLRIDWHYTVNPDKGQEEEGFATIGDFPEALNTFLPFMFQWLSKRCPPIKRLAFGAILMQFVPNTKAGYEKLSTYLHSNVKLDPDNSSDFLYQINRPRNSSSGIAGLRINRLSKWSVAVRVKGLAIVQMPTPTQLFPQQFVDPESIACHLELDINTSPDFGNELPLDQLSNLFHELVDLGKEIALKGDQP